MMSGLLCLAYFPGLIAWRLCRAQNISRILCLKPVALSHSVTNFEKKDKKFRPTVRKIQPRHGYSLQIGDLFSALPDKSDQSGRRGLQIDL
jgi:hypothetical protein